jgi:hypothetical protein
VLYSLVDLQTIDRLENAASDVEKLVGKGNSTLHK